MTDFMYSKAKKKFEDGDVDLLVAGIKIALVAATYSPSQANDEFYDPAIVDDVQADSANLANKSTTDGLFDADPAEFTGVTGDECTMAVAWLDTGTPATSPVLFKLDAGVAGLPYMPSGANVVLNWGAYIFALADA